MLVALRTEQACEPPLPHRQERRLDLLTRRPQDGLELAQRDLLLLLAPRDGIRFFREVGLELLVGAQELEALLVELRRLPAVQLAELVPLPVVGDHREPGKGGAKWQLLPLEGHA